MKKKMLKRGLLGLPLGIAIGHIITLIISAGFGDGGYYPVTPELIDAMGGALNAVILQTVLCGIMGAGSRQHPSSGSWIPGAWQSKARVFSDRKPPHAAHCLCRQLDGALPGGLSLLCGHFRDDFRGRLADPVFQLEAENQKDECRGA